MNDTPSRRRRQQNNGLKQRLLDAANHEIEEHAYVSHKASGITPDEAAKAAAESPFAATAKRDVRNAINAHFQHPTGDSAGKPRQHISEASVRDAAGRHYQALRLQPDTSPQKALWENIHIPPDAVQKSRAGTLKHMAGGHAGEISPEALVQLQDRDRQLVSTYVDQPHQLKRLHQLEHDMTRRGPQHFSRLTPGQQQAHLEYIAHEHAHPELKSRVMTAGNDPTSPGMLGARAARKAGATALAVEGQTFAHHYDGTVTRLHEGQAQMVQQGWDHQKIARRNAQIEKMLGKAGAATEHTGHVDAARVQVREALHRMETSAIGSAERTALKGLKPGHLDAVVKHVAEKLAGGEKMFAADYISSAVVAERAKPGALRSVLTKYFPTFTRGGEAVAQGAASTAGAVAHGAARAAGAVAQAPGAAARAGGAVLSAVPAVLTADITPAVRATGSAIGSAAVTTGKAVGHVSRAVGKGILVTGAVGGGLMLLSSLMSAPRASRRSDAGNGGPGAEEMPVVFTGNPSVGLGAMAVPPMDRQAQAGGWAQRVSAPQPDTGVSPGR